MRQMSYTWVVLYSCFSKYTITSPDVEHLYNLYNTLPQDGVLKSMFIISSKTVEGLGDLTL